MSDVSNLSDTIVPKSDQLNSEQLISGSLTIKVTGVSRGQADQPIVINYEGDNGRPYKPCKSMRKVLVHGWGADGNDWLGRSMTLYNEPSVMFGGVKVGGIRISHMTDIKADMAMLLTSAKGKKSEFFIKKLEIKEHEIFAEIRACLKVEELTALKPKMAGVNGATDAAKKRAAEIRAAEKIDNETKGETK